MAPGWSRPVAPAAGVRTTSAWTSPWPEYFLQGRRPETVGRGCAAIYVKTGDGALVAGAGPIGLLVAAMLKSLGARTIVTELSEARKAKALPSGVADYVLDPSSQDVKEHVLKMTDGIGADIGFECAGVNEVLDLLLDAVRPAGVIVNVSIWGHPATVDMQKLVLKEIDLRGNRVRT